MSFRGMGKMITETEYIDSIEDTRVRCAILREGAGADIEVDMVDLNNLDEMRQIIGSDIDVVYRRIGSVSCTIICDDVGRLTHRTPTIYKTCGKSGISGPSFCAPAIYGTVIIAGQDEDGEPEDLTHDDIREIIEHVGLVGEQGAIII